MSLKLTIEDILKNKEIKNDAILIAEVYRKLGVPTQTSFDTIVRKIVTKELPQIENILRTKREVNSKLNIKNKRLFLIKELHEEHKRKAS